MYVFLQEAMSICIDHFTHPKTLSLYSNLGKVMRDKMCKTWALNEVDFSVFRSVNFALHYTRQDWVRPLVYILAMITGASSSCSLSSGYDEKLCGQWLKVILGGLPKLMNLGQEGISSWKFVPE